MFRGNRKIVIPADRQSVFDETIGAEENWHNFPRSVKRGILEWIFNAKRSPTRAKRIRETVEKAAQNVRVK